MIDIKSYEKAGTHPGLRGIIPLHGKTLKRGQLYPFVGLDNPPHENLISTFGTVNFAPGPFNINHKNLLSITKKGYMAFILFFYKENDMFQPMNYNQHLVRPLSGALHDIIFDNMVDAILFHGVNAGQMCHPMFKHISHKIPKRNLKYLEDITTSRGTSWSMCGTLDYPYQMMSWKLSQPTRGAQNICDGGKSL